METYEKRAAAVKATGGELLPHTNCPACGSERVHVEHHDAGPMQAMPATAQKINEASFGREDKPVQMVPLEKKDNNFSRSSKARDPLPTDPAECRDCGWKGTFGQMVDSVLAGKTVVSAPAPEAPKNGLVELPAPTEPHAEAPAGEVK